MSMRIVVIGPSGLVGAQLAVRLEKKRLRSGEGVTGGRRCHRRSFGTRLRYED
jgi:hypothetical protein